MKLGWRNKQRLKQSRGQRNWKNLKSIYDLDVQLLKNKEDVKIREKCEWGQGDINLRYRWYSSGNEGASAQQSKIKRIRPCNEQKVESHEDQTLDYKE